MPNDPNTSRRRASPPGSVSASDPTDASGFAAETFENLFEEAPVAYFSADPKGSIRQVNRRAEELLEVDASELIGRSVLELYADTPEGREKARRLQERQLQGEDLVDQEVQMVRGDGVPFWAALTVHVIRDDQGEVVERRGAVVDVTERRRAQDALRESEERFRRIFENSNDGIFVLDLEGDRILEANSKAAEMLEYDLEELLGMPISAVHPNEMAALARFVEEVFQLGSGWTDELTCLTKTGDRLPAEISASTVEVAGQRRLIIAARDVTDRRRAEEALRQAHDALERRVQERTEELAETNQRLREEVAHREQAEEAQRHYARRLETLRQIERAILAARSPEDIAQAALVHLERLVPCTRASVAFLDEDSQEWEIAALRSPEGTRLPTGARLPLEALGTVDELRAGRPRVLEDIEEEPPAPAMEKVRREGIRSVVNVPLLARGELIGALNLGHEGPDAFDAEVIDVGREVADGLAVAIQNARLHERLQRHAEELEQRVQERTAELESFSYSVSHDLRAPLRAVDGFSRVLEVEYGERFDDEGRRLLGIIRDSTRQMGELIDDLLAFSRLGRQEMRFGTVNLGELTRSVFAELTPRNSERGVELRFGELPPAQGDPSMLRQVLSNLLSNALKYTRPREHSVIEVGSEEMEGETAYYVRDNGVGFEMEYVDKIFGVFQRLHGAEQFEGTGVGLAIVERIIERHGGRVWAEGRPDEGATIRFTLPPKR